MAPLRRTVPKRTALMVTKVSFSMSVGNFYKVLFSNLGNGQCDQTQDGVEEGGDQVHDVEVVPVRIVDDDGCNETGK